MQPDSEPAKPNRRQLMEESNAAFTKLRKNPEAWSEEQEERKLWEETLQDGLERE